MLGGGKRRLHGVFMFTVASGAHEQWREGQHLLSKAMF